MALINYITQIHFDFGAINVLQSECDRVGIQRPMLVTDAGVRAAGLVDRVLAQLKDPKSVQIYDQTPPNPHEAAVRDALAMYRQGKFDGMIADGLSQGCCGLCRARRAVKGLYCGQWRHGTHHRSNCANHRCADDVWHGQ